MRAYACACILYIYIAFDAHMNVARIVRVRARDVFMRPDSYSYIVEVVA